MKYEVQITYEDYAEAQKAGMTLSGRWYLAMILMATMAVLAWETSGGRKMVDGATVFAVLVTCGAAGYLYKVHIPKSWRRQFDASDAKRLQYTVEFTDDVFHMTSAYENISWPWTFFYRWREGERCFLLYYQNGWSRIIVPKRFLASETEVESVRKILQGKLGKPWK